MHTATSELPLLPNFPVRGPRLVRGASPLRRAPGHVDAATLAAFEHLCRSENTDLFCGIHAAFALLLARCSGEREVALGTPTSDVPGNWVLRTDLTRVPTFRALLAQSHLAVDDARSRASTGLASADTLLQPAADESPALLFRLDLVQRECRPASSGADDAGDSSRDDRDGEDWTPDEASWDGVGSGSGGGGGSEDDREGAAERMAEPESLGDHLLWQLHLSPLSERDRRIGAALIDALDEDGYLREPLSAIAETLLPETVAGEDEILTVLHQLQRFDPVGIGARNLGECLRLQLEVLPDCTPGRALALRIVDGPLERLPRSGIAGIAQELRSPIDQVEQAVQLVRSLDPRPGGCFCEPLEGVGGIEHMRVTFVQPDERIVLTGSLGPLLYEATSGVMDV